MEQSEILQLIRSELTALKNASIVNKNTNSRSLDNYFKIESRNTEEGEVINEDTLGKIPKYIKNELDKKFNVKEPKGDVIVFYIDEIKKLFNDKEDEALGSVIVLLNNNHNKLIEKLDAIDKKLTSVEAKVNSLDTSAISSISNSIDTMITKIDDLQDTVNQLVDNNQTT